MSQEQLRHEILELVSQFATEKYKQIEFKAGETIIPPSGKVLENKNFLAHAICQ